MEISGSNIKKFLKFQETEHFYTKETETPKKKLIFSQRRAVLIF